MKKTERFYHGTDYSDPTNDPKPSEAPSGPPSDAVAGRPRKIASQDMTEPLPKSVPASTPKTTTPKTRTTSSAATTKLQALQPPDPGTDPKATVRMSIIPPVPAKPENDAPAEQHDLELILDDWPEELDTPVHTEPPTPPTRVPVPEEPTVQPDWATASTQSMSHSEVTQALKTGAPPASAQKAPLPETPLQVQEPLEDLDKTLIVPAPDEPPPQLEGDKGPAGTVPMKVPEAITGAITEAPEPAPPVEAHVPPQGASERTVILSVDQPAIPQPGPQPEPKPERQPEPKPEPAIKALSPALSPATPSPRGASDQTMHLPVGQPTVPLDLGTPPDLPTPSPIAIAPPPSIVPKAVAHPAPVPPEPAHQPASGSAWKFLVGFAVCVLILGGAFAYVLIKPPKAATPKAKESTHIATPSAPPAPVAAPVVIDPSLPPAIQEHLSKIADPNSTPKDRAHAMCEIAIIYEYGLGTKSDSAQAKAWYTKAAEGNDRTAQIWIKDHVGK